MVLDPRSSLKTVPKGYPLSMNCIGEGVGPIAISAEKRKDLGKRADIKMPARSTGLDPVFKRQGRQSPVSTSKSVISGEILPKLAQRTKLVKLVNPRREVS